MADLSNKYDIRHQIGKGSFGSAFLVTNKEDKKEYVLKRVRLAKQTKWQRNSTLQERDLVSALNHPFIVPCVETWMVSGHTVNMIYGFCEKGDLATYLQKVQKQRSQVDEGLMVKWLCQLLLALDYLQCKHVLHRDIKTSNLLLTGDLDVQLGDFGLATLMHGAGEGSMPQDTNLVGTPHYMSPELLSCKAYGFKTDVWSLGCVFYELTAQRPTFNAFNIHGLVSKIKKNKLAPLPDSYSQEWRDIVSLMLSKNPERRPSVQELMALPCLRPAILQARARAQQLMPNVLLPPLLDPTPYTSGQRCSGSDAATDSDGSVISAKVARGASVSGGSDRNAVQAAVPESELSQLFSMNSLQRDHGQQLQQQQHGNLSGSGSEQWNAPTDAISSRYSSSSSRGSSRGLGLQLLPNTPPSATRVLDGYKRVAQPGIKRTAAERVAAAIAAAQAAQEQAAGKATGEAAGEAAGGVPSPLSGTPASEGRVPRLQLKSGTAGPWCPGSATSRDSRQVAAGSCRTRTAPLSAREPRASDSPTATERPAWRMTGASSPQSAVSLNSRQQRRNTPKAGTTGTATSKVAVPARTVCRAGQSDAAVKGPTTQRGFLQQLEEHAGGDSGPPAAGLGSLQQQRRLPGNPMAGLSPLLLQKQQQGCHTEHRAGAAALKQCLAADEDEDDSCCGGDSAIKQLHFDTASPSISSRRMSDVATPSDLAAASTPGTGTATTPASAAMLASAADAAADQDGSSALWSMDGSAILQKSISSQACGSDGTADRSCPPPHSSSADGAAMSTAMAGHASNIGTTTAGADRLELLESVLPLLGALYSKGRWHELGSVLATTPGLLPDSLQPAVQAQRFMARQASSQGRGAAASSGGKSHTAHAGALKLDDIVVLGSKRIRGKIRYIGPVAWDPSGQDWVGMALDSPCGTDSQKNGISYFDCPPKCAAFHKASVLTSRPGTNTKVDRLR